MDKADLLAAAKAAPEKQNIEEYREVVNVLREKGFTWREVADFLTERGVSIDHTRLYRQFGSQPEDRRMPSREIEIQRVTFIGEKKKGGRTTWNVMDIELPSKLGVIVVKGFACHVGSQPYEKDQDDTLKLRNPKLNLRPKTKGFPVACITADFKMYNGDWMQQEVYIVPKWEEIL